MYSYDKNKIAYLLVDCLNVNIEISNIRYSILYQTIDVFCFHFYLHDMNKHRNHFGESSWKLIYVDQNRTPDNNI